MIIFLMEVECSRVQDQLIISYKIMLHLFSKDNNKVIREQSIKVKGDPSPLKIKSFEDQMLNFMSENKRILNLHE